MQLRMLSSRDADFETRLQAVLRYDGADDSAIDRVAAEVCSRIRTEGDVALLEYTARWDRLALPSASALEVPRDDLEGALATLPREQREALERAAERIREYHTHQKLASWRYTDTHGNVLGQQVTALDRVGLYVPGGKAAYPSSILMNAIPAKVAGVPELIMVTPTPGGESNAMVLAAAAIAGVDRVFRIGGAQAVAALAYGTQTIPAVDKIVGPGNAYVAAAKRRVFGVVGIDMIAGPSEVLIIADGSVPADWTAMDLFSQAEHDELAQAILITTSHAHRDEVAASIEKLLPAMPRRTIIESSLMNRCALIVVDDLAEACALSNRIAPEHLELAVQAPEALLPQIRHAGAIFLGQFSSESLGDYCAGPNHVLPTSGTARFSSPLGVYDFQKRSSIIGISRVGAAALGPLASTLARGEGLVAHARSAEMRGEA